MWRYSELTILPVWAVDNKIIQLRERAVMVRVSGVTVKTR